MNIPLFKDYVDSSFEFLFHYTVFSLGSRMFFLRLLLLCFSSYYFLTFRCYKHASFINLGFLDLAFINLFPRSVVLVDLRWCLPPFLSLSALLFSFYLFPPISFLCFYIFHSLFLSILSSSLFLPLSFVPCSIVL